MASRRSTLSVSERAARTKRYLERRGASFGQPRGLVFASIHR
jgi:hypothetical protein